MRFLSLGTAGDRIVDHAPHASSATVLAEMVSDRAVLLGVFGVCVCVCFLIEVHHACLVSARSVVRTWDSLELGLRQAGAGLD